MDGKSRCRTASSFGGDGQGIDDGAGFRGQVGRCCQCDEVSRLAFISFSLFYILSSVFDLCIFLVGDEALHIHGETRTCRERRG